MIKEFNGLEEIQKYYDKETNTYIFKENGFYINLVNFNFNLCVDAHIDAWNIKAWNINAYDIDAWNINAYGINAHKIDASNINASNIEAFNIKACDISYYAVCFAYNNIECKSIKGRRANAKHFVLDGKLEVEEDE